MLHLKRTICQLLFLAILASAGAAQAATYYVATTGSDSTSCAQAQSVSTPKHTIPGGIACLASGDTLLVRGGTYTDQTIQKVISGTTGAYTTIKAYPGEHPKINQSNPTGFVRGVYFDGPFHHIEINGFEFDGVFNIMKFDETGGWAHHINFINNIAHDTVHVGIYITSSIDGTTGGDHILRGNTFYNIGKLYPNPPYIPGFNAIYGTGNRTIIENNIFHNCRDGIAIYMSLTPTRPLHNVIVRNNLFYQMGRDDIDTWQAGANGGSAAGVYVPGGGHQIYNNVIHDSGHVGIIVNYGPASNIGIYNNTVYNQTLSHNYAVAVYTGSNINVKNNIAYMTGGILSGTQSNNLMTNPLFVNSDAADFHLQSGSAAIDAGITAAGVTNDHDGKPRPVGVSYDIGAYEGVGSLDSSSPLPPKGLTVK